MKPVSLALIGFMASGKSTVGRRLADRLALPFIDLDDLIERREGASVSELFRERGELGFRAAEREALEAVLAGPPAVLACGGGASCQPGAMDALRGWGRTVFLDVSLEALRRRLSGGDDARPLWDEDVALRYMERQASYRSADWIVDGGQPPEGVAAAIVRALEESGE